MQMSENKMIVADALSRIDSVLDTEPVPVSDEPQHPKDGSVKLSDVHFSYDGETEVIKGVSMDIKSGQTVALVGPSGGGKSTLASLMCRFFDVQSGSISIGGADVRAVPKEELMDTVSFVFQYHIPFCPKGQALNPRISNFFTQEVGSCLQSVSSQSTIPFTAATATTSKPSAGPSAQTAPSSVP